MARKTPHNYICLFIFTLAESFMVGVMASLYQRQIVLYAVLITGVICLGLTLFAFQTKIDFTIFNGMMFIIFLVFMMFGFIMLFFPRSNTMHLIYSCIGAFLFSAFLVIDTQMIMGGTHKQQISTEDYISFRYSYIFSQYLVLFLLIDTQMIVGGSHKQQFSTEDYVFAALTLYLDIINIFTWHFNESIIV
ncbi:lifeguard-like protein [Euroglyphus maynei]|uniref:Lifeguard-like protein n=1 Tax=Euroglyphus maynei TaxID=6958 RepID=A0A1Y3AXE2_EURMA|nr:lifeguard-like protein [Euroglyphus maynei]